LLNTGQLDTVVLLVVASQMMRGQAPQIFFPRTAPVGPQKWGARAYGPNRSLAYTPMDYLTAWSMKRVDNNQITCTVFNTVYCCLLLNSSDT